MATHETCHRKGLKQIEEQIREAITLNWAFICHLGVRLKDTSQKKITAVQHKTCHFKWTVCKGSDSGIS